MLAGGVDIETVTNVNGFVGVLRASVHDEAVNVAIVS